MDTSTKGIRTQVLQHIDQIAKNTGTDLFLLRPKASDPETAGVSYAGAVENSLEQRFRVMIFGDMESMEHAKTRTLIMVDQIVSN